MKNAVYSTSLGGASRAIALAAALSFALLTGCSADSDKGGAKTEGAAMEATAQETVKGETGAAGGGAVLLNTGEPVVRMTGDTESGKKIYEQYCHFCHGRTGLGDGPVGIAITPHPADFVHDTKRMSKTDEELFKSITEGIHKEIGGEEMAMPRWAEILSEKERWDVLHYIRKLEREGKEAEKGARGGD